MFARLTALTFIMLLPSLLVAEAQFPLNYRTLDNELLSFKIGEMLFLQPGEGCWTCHGASNSQTLQVTETTKNKVGAVLHDPATWTSHKITPFYNSEKAQQLDQRQIALSLIRLGAEEWNTTMVPIIRKFSSADVLFFDDRMIGIHSKYLKKNSKKIRRMLKREKVKFKSGELMDIMATSVFLYLESNFNIEN